jgi:rhodanese-related sulfurtransferase
MKRIRKSPYQIRLLLSFFTTSALFVSLFVFSLSGTVFAEQAAPKTKIRFVEKKVGRVVPSDVAYKLRQEGADIVFVSVRERAEWDEYHIPGAVWLPHSRLKEQDEFSWKRLEELARTHDYVLTYCGAGHRSGFVAASAQKRGLDNVYNLDGISFWKQDFVVSKGPKRAADKEPKMVHLDEAYYYFTAGFDDVDFIDVREPESIMQAGGKTIKSAKVIPLSELMKNLKVIDCKKDTVFFCEGTFDGGECSAGPAAGKIVIDKLGCKAGHIKYLLEGFGAWEAKGYPVERYQG